MYQFPLIRHINEVLPYVVSNPHFVVIEREYGRIIDYVISDDTTFEDPEDHFLSSDDIQGRLIRRECRGLIFDNDGNIISRALHKFHNIGEKKYSQLENLNFSKPFRVGEKLDGSMIRPFMANGYIRWGTRKGITDVSMQAEEFVAEHVNYQEFASYFLSIGYTPIFEWCSRKQRIVIDHASDRLVLLAIRNQETGVYYPYLEMAVHAAEFRVEYLKWDLVTDPKDLISKIKDDTDREGIVIQFTDSGLFVKMKTDWYVLLHRTKDQLGREKDGIKLILMDGIDDLLPILLHDDKEALIAFQIAFNKEIARKANRICIGVHTNMVKYPTKRDFAVEYVNAIVDPLLRSFFFQAFEIMATKQITIDTCQVLIANLIRDKILKHCSSGPKLAEVKGLYGNLRWIYDKSSDSANDDWNSGLGEIRDDSTIIPIATAITGSVEHGRLH